MSSTSLSHYFTDIDIRIIRDVSSSSFFLLVVSSVEHKHWLGLLKGKQRQRESNPLMLGSV